jgi:AcrR family transcriptional regulator
VDRIGTAAQVNKALIYTYFGNKDQLFDAVMDTHVTRVLEQVPFTPADLPDYAGRLFDFLLANPHQLRLATWHRLERAGTGHDPAELSSSQRGNADLVAQAQADQQVPTDFTPEDLFVFTLALASAWMPGSPFALPGVDHQQIESHRTNVVEAVRRLTTALTTGANKGRPGRGRR